MIQGCSLLFFIFKRFAVSDWLKAVQHRFEGMLAWKRGLIDGILAWKRGCISSRRGRLAGYQRVN